jgi:hypothetical protein
MSKISLELLKWKLSNSPDFGHGVLLLLLIREEEISLLVVLHLLDKARPL